MKPDYKQSEEFEKIVSRMVAEFPTDKFDWNKRVAPYLREFAELLQSKEEPKPEKECKHNKVDFKNGICCDCGTQFEFVQKPQIKELNTNWPFSELRTVADKVNELIRAFNKNL